jgi:hypothetical protein
MTDRSVKRGQYTIKYDDSRKYNNIIRDGPTQRRIEKDKTDGGGGG